MLVCQNKTSKNTGITLTFSNVKFFFIKMLLVLMFLKNFFMLSFTTILITKHTHMWKHLVIPKIVIKHRVIVS